MIKTKPKLIKCQYCKKHFPIEEMGYIGGIKQFNPFIDKSVDDREIKFYWCKKCYQKKLEKRRTKHNC